MEELDYRYVRTTRPQREFLSCTDDVVVWRDANAIGKSVALALCAHDVARGFARFRPLRQKPPVQILVAGESMSQMVPLMEKIYALAPKDEIDPRCRFDPGRGITGKPPRVVYTSGPGAGSVIHFATYEQGARRIAGFQGALAICDEPPPQSFFGELRPRVMRSGGELRIGFTPTISSPPLDWLWDLVDEQKLVTEINFGLSEEACHLELRPGVPHPRGPWKTQAELDLFIQSYIPAERAMRSGKSRYPLVEGRWITGFDQQRHVNETRPDPHQEHISFGIGIDYGLVPGKQSAALVAVFQPHGSGPVVWFLDCYVPEEVTSPEQDAVGILDMLRRNGLEYNQVDTWVGDRAAEGKKGAVRKDNKDMRAWLAATLGVDTHLCRFIYTPYKRADSVMSGAQLINSLFIHNRAHVHPRCRPLIDAFTQFNGHPKHPTKDVFDAARYALERMVKRGSWMTRRSSQRAS